jgi:hypothetical protein
MFDESIVLIRSALNPASLATHPSSAEALVCCHRGCAW